MKVLLTTLLIMSLTTINEWEFKAATSQSSLTIFGTSTLHDWESVVNDFTVSGVMSDEEVKDLNVEVVVKSIKSGKSIMDDKTYDALKADKYGKVKFSAAKLNVNGDQISGTGELQLAGVTKPIALSAQKMSQTATGTKIKGAVELDMTEFGIKPPTAMFGTVETGEKVKIEYELLLNR